MVGGGLVLCQELQVVGDLVRSGGGHLLDFVAQSIGDVGWCPARQPVYPDAHQFVRGGAGVLGAKSTEGRLLEGGALGDDFEGQILYADHLLGDHPLSGVGVNRLHAVGLRGRPYAAIAKMNWG